MRKRGRIVPIVSVDCEIVAIVTVKAILGSDPEEAIIILIDAVNGILRQAILHGQMPETHLLSHQWKQAGIHQEKQQNSACHLLWILTSEFRFLT